MNQTKKRLAIIKLAISMTDTETIQLQVLKLGMLKTDSRMRDILRLLNENSYARAQELISAYIEAPSDKTVLQRTSQEEVTTPKPTPTLEEAMIEPQNIVEPSVEKTPTLQEKIQTAKDQAIIDEFDLFIEDPETEPKEAMLDDINYDALADIAPAPKKMSSESINYDSLLNVEAQDVLSNNIDLDISTKKEDTFFKEETDNELFNDASFVSNGLQEDTFFDIEDEVQKPKQAPKKEEFPINDMAAQEKRAQDNFFKESVHSKTEEEFIKKHLDNDLFDETKQVDEPLAPSPSEQIDITVKPVKTSSEYKAISYIDQKFKNMYNQYPPVDEDNSSFASVDAWLLKISNDGYSEKEVEEMIQFVEKLSQSNKAEAAQLLLITAATESKYAQFRLARALYKGELLKKNLAEAFTLINRLALNDSYPEAICDLAQFYENGIGITKDKKKAEQLYKEAMELGIQRAIDHYEKIRKENKSFFSSFKR